DFRSRLGPGPCNVLRGELCLIAADLYCGGAGLREIQNDAWNDVVGADRKLPIRQLYGFEVRDALIDQIAIGAAPAVTFVVLARFGTDGRVGRLLHFDIQTRINLQSAFVYRRRAVFLFEISPQFFNKVWCKFIWPLFLRQFDLMRLDRKSTRMNSSQRT